MLDTSQSYLPLRRGSSDEDDFEQSPPLDKQPQHSPPMRWKDILLIISGVTNLAALCLILSYLFFFSSFSSSSPAADDYPASTKCSAATTAYPQTSYSKHRNLPSVAWGRGLGREYRGEKRAVRWTIIRTNVLDLFATMLYSWNPHISWKMATGNMVVNV